MQKQWFKTLFKDTAVYGVGQGIARAMQIFILPIIAHSLTVAEYGFYSNYVIFYSIVGGLLVWGLDSAVARFFYDSSELTYHKRLFSSAFIFILATGVMSIFLFRYFQTTILTALDIPAEYSSALRYVVLLLPFYAINNFLLCWFKWRRKLHLFLLNLLGTVVLLLIPLAVMSNLTIDKIFKVIMYSQLATAALSLAFCGKYFTYRIDRLLLLKILSYGFPWMLVFLLGISKTYIDRFFLTHIISADAYGIYNFSIRIASIVTLFTAAFDASFGPVAFGIWKKDGASTFFAKTQTLYILLLSMLSTIICIFSGLLTSFFGGTKYGGSETWLPFLIFSSVIYSLMNFSSLGISYAKKSILIFISLFAGLLLIMILNFFLTPHIHEWGAIIASIAGHLAIIALCYILSRKLLRVPFAYIKDSMVMILYFGFSVFTVYVRLFEGQFLDIAVKLVLLFVLTGALLGIFYGGELSRVVNYLAKFIRSKSMAVSQINFL